MFTTKFLLTLTLSLFLTIPGASAQDGSISTDPLTHLTTMSITPPGYTDPSEPNHLITWLCQNDPAISPPIREVDGLIAYLKHRFANCGASCQVFHTPAPGTCDVFTDYQTGEGSNVRWALCTAQGNRQAHDNAYAPHDVLDKIVELRKTDDGHCPRQIYTNASGGLAPLGNGMADYVLVDKKSLGPKIPNASP